MKRKTKQPPKASQSTQEKRITESIRKSKLNASNEFEYRKLGREQDGFLNCLIEEEEESLTFTYKIPDVLPWTDIKREKKELQFLALIDVGKLQKAAKVYRFTLAPENLYYDIHGRVFIKTRDVYSADEEYEPEDFLREYKSLIGCTLAKKYTFENYDKGGLDLLTQDRFLKEILECSDTDQILLKLHEEYFRYRKMHRQRFTEISKARNTGNRIALGIMGAFTIAGAVLLIYFFAWERPYEEAVIAANEAYLQSDYSAAIEAMEDVAVERMNGFQKYILAYSCVRCESFNEDNMRNILNTVVLNGDEKVMEYWIHINRLETEKAADIAMQKSSNQLLFYAYLKEKAVIENDTTLSGEEKNARLTEIENKLKPLEEEFSALTEK